MNAAHMARRKELWEQKQNSLQTLQKNSRGRPSGFVKETAAVIGKTKQKVGQLAPLSTGRRPNRREQRNSVASCNTIGRPKQFAAETVLDALIERADLIGRDIYGGAFLLIHVDRDTFEDLCSHGAETEDMEPEPIEDDDDAEPAAA